MQIAPCSSVVRTPIENTTANRHVDPILESHARRCVAQLAPTPSGCIERAGERAGRSSTLRRTHLAQPRAVPRRANRRSERRDRPAGRLLRRAPRGRRVEDDERRRDLVPDLRRGEGRLVGRRGRRRGVRSERRVHRHGRSHHRRLDQRGQRRLQVDGRGTHVEAHGPRRDEADSVDSHRPARSERRARRRAGGHSREERPARRVPLDRRRRDVDEDALRRGLDRRAEAGARERRAERDLRDDGVALHAATAAGRRARRCRWRRRRLRGRRQHSRRADRDARLQVDRRWRDVDHAERRGLAPPHRPHVDRRRDEHQRAARVRDRGRWSLPVGRRRRDLAADGRQRSENSKWAGRLQLWRVRRPEKSGRRVHDQHLEL